MSIFAKPLSELRAADLQELLQQPAVENARLEFKLEVPNKDETLKKLSSFANTFGGFMVIGAKASSTDGRIEDLPGVEAQPGYKQKVVQWCFDGSVRSQMPLLPFRKCGAASLSGVYEFSARFEARMHLVIFGDCASARRTLQSPGAQPARALTRVY